MRVGTHESVVRTTPTVAVRVRRERGQDRGEHEDLLATEEPLEIRIRHGPQPARQETRLGITMRTPGHDFELVAGLLVAEGIVSSPAQVERIDYVGPATNPDYANIVAADLGPRVPFEAGLAERKLLTTSACGVCGKASLETLSLRGIPRLPPNRPRLRDARLRALPARLRQEQAVFAKTGGLHAAALFNDEGTLLALREDVGRHNAVDKLLGAQFLAGRTPCSDALLLVSGRASYEIAQKALVAGVPFVAAVGAPSSLAVDVAREFSQTLVGFLRDDGYNIYSGPGRIHA